MKLRYACPSCGAEVNFRLQSAVMAVCAYCGGILVRDSDSLRSIGKSSIDPPDLTPLQVGTMGKYKNINFTIVGRQRFDWSDGFWNEWTVLFDDQRVAVLEESQGFFMMLFPVHTGVPDVHNPDANLGFEFKYMGKTMTLSDIKDAKLTFVQGEFNSSFTMNSVHKSYDFTGPSGEFATLDLSKNVSRFLVGDTVDLEKLDLTNLKQLSGWT
jgi:hypothetical protein